MITNCLNWILNFIGDMFSFFDNFTIYGSISVIGIFVGALIICLVIDNFLPKG